MSDINLDFTVSNNNINFTVEPNDITITPTDIQLTLAQSISLPSGNNGELQYNANGVFGGIPTTNYNGSNLSLGNVANIKITGGVNGYVLQTDGTGNLDWTAQTGGGGNGSPGGSNTQIQYNDAGTFGGNVGFTFNEVNGNVAIPGNLSVVGNITGTLLTGAQNNITSLGTLISLSVAGTTTIQQAQEKVTSNNIGSTGTINYDLLNQAIIYKTANATANFTLNFRGNSTTTLDSIMSSNQSMTCTFINTNGNTGYLANAFSIDGNLITPNWLNGDTPVLPTANAKDMYNFNILKTNANTFVVFGTTGGYY
jgi:hypothetical protein